MKTPKPWYWSSRKAWYVEIAGKQVRLGPADSKTKNPPKEVNDEFYRLMSGQGLLSEKERTQTTVPVVVEAFIEGKAATSRDKTVKAYVFFLNPFAVQFKSRRFNTIKPEEVLDYVKGKGTWTETTRCNAVRAIKTLFKWAKDSDYIASNPIALVKNPYHAQSRERGISLDEFRQMIEATRDDEFKAVLRFLRDTGCRPGDVCILAARHLVPGQPIAKLKPSEHKTGSRTGKPKEIFLTGPIHDEVKELAKRYPDGPLFRNTQGEPWKTETIRMRVAKLRKKLGLPDHVIPYAGRHAFLTRLIELGTPLPIAAKIAGHQNTKTLEENYLHPEKQTMIDAVNRAANFGAESGGETPTEKIARLERENGILREENAALKARIAELEGGFSSSLAGA